MVFGDIVLQQTPVRDIHGKPQQAGAGGWPTIRYFNKQTGYGGAAYPKRFDGMAMCDELGKMEYMQDYVENYGGASLCSIDTLKGCSDAEKTMINSFKGKGAAEVKKEIASYAAKVGEDEKAIEGFKKEQESLAAKIKNSEENVKKNNAQTKILNKILTASHGQEL